MTFPLNEMYGYSRLCGRLRSSAIIWKQVSLRSSAIRDRLRSFAIIWKLAFKKKLKIKSCPIRSMLDVGRGAWRLRVILILEIGKPLRS